MSAEIIDLGAYRARRARAASHKADAAVMKALTAGAEDTWFLDRRQIETTATSDCGEIMDQP